jgi:hypothetical protein
MQCRLALTLAYLKLCTLVLCIFLNPKPQYQILLKAPILSKQTAGSSLPVIVSEDICYSVVCSAAVGILQSVERPGSVYSIMPQWWHLMVLQYVASSFHLPSVSTANINTVQYTKQYQQCEYQQSQMLWYPRCCFLSPTSWQPLFTATVCTSLVSLQVCQRKQISWTQFTVAFHMAISCSGTCLLCPNINIQRYI